MEEQFPGEGGKSLREYVEAIKRRKKVLWITAGLVFLSCVLAAILLPPVYRSTATILIEEQEIPQDLVRSTISSYADQRIQIISQQVMTRTNLMRIVERYDLYPDERKAATSEEILARMREHIKLDIVNAEVIDRRSGAKTNAMIAFKLSYLSDNADKAQKVANELTSLYLNENLQIRQQKAEDTYKFLTEEADRIEAAISDIEGKLATFKSANLGRLPELVNANMQMRDRAESEWLEVDRRLASLEERRFYMESQLAQVKPNAPITGSDGALIPDPEERLRGLRAQYSASSGIYSASHPDMVRLRQQMEGLQREVGDVPDGSGERQELARLENDLAKLRERYSEDHPDVTKLKARIAALELPRDQPELRKLRERSAKPENPAYISLQVQLDGLDADARSLHKLRVSLRQRMDDLEGRIAQTPAVEKDYQDLVRDRENSLLRYREIKAKQMEAAVAQQLEKDRKSERFSLIDPPVMPQKPLSPNRPLILLMGVVLALAGGGASVGILEALDKSIHSPRELGATVPLPLLAVIPYIGTPDEQQVRRRRLPIVLGALAALLVMALLAIDLLWIPLDILWLILLRRFGL